MGDHDRPSEALREAWSRWESISADAMGIPPDKATATPDMLLGQTHDDVRRAALRLVRGPIGTMLRSQLRGLPSPKVVGVSVMYSGQVLAAAAVTAIVRELWPGALVVFGGAHVTALRDEIAHDAGYGFAADRFVYGYAEVTWTGLLDAVSRGTPLPPEVHEAGNGDTRRALDDASLVPHFDAPRSLAGRLTLPAQASRGCAYGRCAFCTYPAVEGGYRPVANLSALSSLVDQAEQLGAALSFKDSLVTPARLERLASTIGGRVHWSACTKLHPRLTKDFLTGLAASGCRTLEVGLETLTTAGQLVIDKRQALPLFLRVLDGAAHAGIGLVVNYMTGFPGVDPVEEHAWLQRVRAEIAARPSLVAKVEHNEFQLERRSPMGRSPERYGVEVVEASPWATVMAWREGVGVAVGSGDSAAA